jgi:N-carbamoylputrescine amidase
MTKNIIQVGLVQQAYSDNRNDNLETVISGIRQAKQQGAELVLLSELHNSLYFCQTEDARLFDLAESIPGPTTEQLGAIAKELKVVIVASLFERRAAGIYHNTAVVLEQDGSIAGKYRKMHIPDDPGYYEKYYFTPGDLGFTPIDCSLGRLGILICWDQWYPEAARLMALAGAEILLYPTAIGGVPMDSPELQAKQCDAWVTIQRAHAIANGLPVVVCNRTGIEGGKEGIDFWGSSFICDAQGAVLARASKDSTENLVVAIDKSQTEKIRRQWPYLRDRRIDAYAELVKRYIE